mmetsp:Transcript_55491/g.60100  ORF Transcript_55491/g.60100 Transcript_55491/m.60100 type:complete len:439 (+) Transcript_55491:58-1374(+)
MVNKNKNKNKRSTVVSKGSNKGDCSDRENAGDNTPAGNTRMKKKNSTLRRKIVRAFRPSKGSKTVATAIRSDTDTTIQRDEGSHDGEKKNKTKRKRKQKIYKPSTGANNNLKTISEDNGDVINDSDDKQKEREDDFAVMPSNNQIVEYKNGYCWSEGTPKALGNYDAAIATGNNYFLPSCSKQPPLATANDIAIFKKNQSEYLPQFSQVAFSAKNKRSRNVPDEDEDADFDEEQDDHGSTARKRRKIASTWVCSSCHHSNDDDESCCTAPKCGVYRKAEVESTSLWKVDYGNKWQCPICKVFNGDSLMECTTKCGPKSTVDSSSGGAINNSFSTAIVASTTTAATASTGGFGFVFGKPNENTTVVVASTATAATASAGSIGNTGFVFSMPTENTTTAGTVNFSFGSNAVTATTESSSIVPTGGIKFGLFGKSSALKKN